MRSKIHLLLAAMIALVWSGQFAQAGAIRYAGKELHDGSVAVVQKASDVSGTAAGNVEDVSKQAGSALKDGTATLGKDAASVPGAAVHGTKAAASKVWKAVW